MSYSQAAAPQPTRRPARKAVWPFVLSGVLACALVAGAVVFFVVRRDTPAATGPADSATAGSSRMLAEGVTAGGTMTGAAKTLATALTGRGLECSVRFTTADGGHSGCFLAAGGGTVAVEYQYQADGAVNALTLVIKGKSETAPILQTLTATIGQVVFPADRSAVLTTMRQSWGGAVEGKWGKYEIVGRGSPTRLDAEKFGNKQLKVPSLHLETTELGLAKALNADGYTCAGIQPTCQGQYAGKPGLALKFSGPDDGGITYLVATAATGTTSEKAFAQLRSTVFGHLRGDAVAPVQEWISQHLGGGSHIAYVAGWRVDLEVTAGKQIRLTLFNEEFFLQMT